MRAIRTGLMAYSPLASRTHLTLIGVLGGYALIYLYNMPLPEKARRVDVWKDHGCSGTVMRNDISSASMHSDTDRKT
ncbi:hypothetical protein BD310DRAFT_924136 [Dichomitus squalens]|uniref:Uncharacterized protein n=1 Tax=Dichomitus squalens TaxID=114155 RepID=A0A4Q9PYC7_9APHY|nr:hypothetical protein BD310DRAFT_924136 [Dichomitus squalens]